MSLTRYLLYFYIMFSGYSVLLLYSVHVLRHALCHVLVSVFVDPNVHADVRNVMSIALHLTYLLYCTVLYVLDCPHYYRNSGESRARQNSGRATFSLDCCVANDLAAVLLVQFRLYIRLLPTDSSAHVHEVQYNYTVTEPGATESSQHVHV